MMKRILILFIVINNSYGMQQQPGAAAASPRTDPAAIIQKLQTTILPTDIDALLRSMTTIERRLSESGGETTYTSSRNDVKVVFILAGLKAEVYKPFQKDPVHCCSIQEFKKIIGQVKAKTNHID